MSDGDNQDKLELDIMADVDGEETFHGSDTASNPRPDLKQTFESTKKIKPAISPMSVDDPLPDGLLKMIDDFEPEESKFSSQIAANQGKTGVLDSISQFFQQFLTPQYALGGAMAAVVAVMVIQINPESPGDGGPASGSMGGYAQVEQAASGNVATVSSSVVDADQGDLVAEDVELVTKFESVIEEASTVVKSSVSDTTGVLAQQVSSWRERYDLLVEAPKLVSVISKTFSGNYFSPPKASFRGDAVEINYKPLVRALLSRGENFGRFPISQDTTQWIVIRGKTDDGCDVFEVIDGDLENPDLSKDGKFYSHCSSNWSNPISAL